MKGLLFRIFAFLLMAFTVSNASAHRLGESYIFLSVTEQALSGRIEVTETDLAKLPNIDANQDGIVDEAEFQASATTIYSTLQRALVFRNEGVTHPIKIVSHDLLNIEDLTTFAQLQFEVPSLTAPPQEINAEYRFLFDGIDPQHRGLLVIENNPRAGISDNESEISVIFGPGNEQHRFNLDGVPWTQVFVNFVKHGVWHIWIGFDHILFLVALLLPSVLLLGKQGWEPVQTFREAFIYVLKVVTLFTVAHTITLSLAALKIVSLPSQWVEAIIAASIAVVALNNLYPFLRGRTWSVVFLFGLFHGLGFANVLEPLGVSPHSTVSALIGFNIGVEIGQIAIVLAIFPMLFLLRERPLYRGGFLKFASFALIAISMFWLLERTVDIPFLTADNTDISAISRLAIG